MAQLTDHDLRILELAERLERIENTKGLKEGLIRAELNVSATRFTQQLMHLVQRPDVEADPRWTMMAHRIRTAMSSAAQIRASRTFRRETA